MNANLRQETIEKLQAHNVRPSYPRVKIYEALCLHKSHPTVDEIFMQLSKDLPTLSKTTVYNTLDLFEKVNLAQRISIDDHEARYDATVDYHGHFRCDLCRTIYDFPVTLDLMKVIELEGFQVREKNLYIKGVCPRCLARG